MRKLRPLFAVTLAVCMCLNSTAFAAVSTAAESPADNGSAFLFSEEFEHLDPAIWTVSSGTWDTQAAEDGNQALAGTGTSLISAGENTWTDYEMSYDITPTSDGAGGSAGGVFRYQDDDNFYHFRLMDVNGSKYAALLQWKGGKSKPLGSRVPYEFEIGATYRCSIRAVGNHLAYYVWPAGEAMPAEPVLEYTDESDPLLSGGIGFRVYAPGQALFDNVLVTQAQAEPTVTVSFDTDGGSAISAQQVQIGRTLSEPAAPTKDGFLFGGWYEDAARELPFSFDTPLSADLTLYAKWIALPAGETVSVTDDFSGDLSAWSLVKGPDGSFRIPEGDDRLLASNSSSGRAEFILTTYAALVDSVIEVDVTVEDDSKDFTVGIITRFSDSKNHLLACYTSGKGARFVDRAGSTVTPDPSVTLEKGKTYHFKLISSGSTFRFFIDDQEIYSVQNTAHPFGQVGLYTSNSSEIYFDNFELSGSLVPEGTDFPATGVVLNREEMTLEEGQILGLSAVVEPFYATNQAVEWRSEDAAIAQVDQNGKVRGIAPGATKIIVETQDGGHTDSCNVTVVEAPPEREQNAVVPIQWDNFAPGPFTDSLALKYAKAANNNMKYNLFYWLDSQFGTDPGEYYPLGSTVKGYAALAFVSATVLSMDVYDEALVGHTREEAVDRTVKLIASIAYKHRSNQESGGWGVSPDKTTRGASDQTALDANVCGTAAWLMWEYLPDEYREYARRMVEYEANSLIDYEVPYYQSPDGTIITPGNTRGEENAWNSGVLALALSMMPNHQNREAWAEKCTELMLSSYATPNDLLNTHEVDGKAVKDWLNGSNAENNGIAINHSRIHPDYMAVIAHLLNGAVQFAMSGQTVPEETVFNADLIYQAYVDLEFETPEYNEPGGSMYKSLAPKLYYPMTNDYGDNRLMHVASIDVFADALGFDHNVTLDGEYWANVHIDEILRLQDRFTDGRTYIDDEEGGSSGSERWVSVHLARAMMGIWLRQQRQSGTVFDFEHSPEADALPDGFMQYTIGNTYGTVEYDGTYKLDTMGWLGDTEDAFRYVYQYTDGNASIAVAITELQSQGSISDAAAGVMFQSGTKSEDAPNVYLGYSDGKLTLAVRETAGGERRIVEECTAALPISVKLEQSGAVINAYCSVDGTWRKLGSAALEESARGTIGFLAASGSNDAFAHAEFEVLSDSGPESPEPESPVPEDKHTSVRQNPDGSTTTTVTDRRTGEVTSTTTYPNGVKIVAVTGGSGASSIEVTVPDRLGRVTITVPTDTPPGPGMVPVRIGGDGGREVVKLSAAAGQGITLSLDGSARLELVDNSVSFADVPDSHWAADAIDFVSSRGLFLGGDGGFQPGAGMSRAMLFTVLARLEGVDVSGGTPWYSPAVDWVQKAGVSDGSAPESLITREQLAVMFYRFVGPEAAAADLTGFSDYGDISDWSLDAMCWAVSEGILTGSPDGRLFPASPASRAEAAMMLQRLIESMLEQ